MDLRNFDLVDQIGQKNLVLSGQSGLFQITLANPIIPGQFAGHLKHQTIQIVTHHHAREDFLAEFCMLTAIGFQFFLQDAGHRFCSRSFDIHFCFSCQKDFTHQRRFCAVKLQKLCPLLSFCHHTDNAARHLYQLLNVRNRADMIKLLYGRILNLRISLSNKTDSLVAHHGFLDCRNRLRAADIETGGHFRKDRQTTQSDHRHSYDLSIFHQVSPCKHKITVTV